MISTPQSRLFFAALLTLIITLTAANLAMHVPALDMTFVPDENGHILINSIRPESTNTGLVSPGSQITQLNRIPLDSNLLIEEPDQLGSWSRYNNFLSRLHKIYQSHHADTIEAEVEHKPVTLHTRERTFNDLPLMFWYQIIVGALAFLIAAGVYAFRQQDRGAMHFTVAGLGIFASSASAAIYSTRELIIDGNMVHISSLINQFGAIFFTAALVALLWEYPKRIQTNRLVVPLIYLTALLIWSGFAFQLYPDTGTVYSLVLALFSISFVFAFIQWKQSEHTPVARAALKWYLLSIYIGTGLFATVILFPVALGIEPPASQGVMFIVFLFMFVGIAFGITRYRLFDLDRWWLTAWVWFLGGLLVIATDAVLLWLLNINHQTSLTLSLALIGWLYFPGRQWLFRQLHHQKQDRNSQIHRLVHSLFSAEDSKQLANLWQQYLIREFEVLDSKITSGRLEEPTIVADAQNLIVPHLIDGQLLTLIHPRRGSRLFNRNDQETVQLLYALAKQARDALLSRQHAQEEKQRIFGDLHDDVGAKLLSLVYKSSDPNSMELARSALQDLRDVVSQPDSGEIVLQNALADWRAEAQERLAEVGIALKWQQNVIYAGSVSVFRIRHVARIIREAINNVIKHSPADKVDVSIQQTNQTLNITISDNGFCPPPEAWKSGQGISNIRHRLQKLGGSGHWQQNDEGGCTMQVEMPMTDPK